MRTAGYDDARSQSTHQCPQSTKGVVANDVEIERSGTPQTTVSQQSEQVTTRYGLCNDVKIEHIGTSHTTPKENSLQSKQKPNQITYRITINPKINSEIEVTLLPCHDGN
jgi:hypothetical protein